MSECVSGREVGTDVFKVSRTNSIVVSRPRSGLIRKMLSDS